jgi:hypothetical protein
MSGLHALLVRSAEAGLALQDGDSGALPAGHNGCWGHRETPVRNTSHWLVTFLRAFELSGGRRLLEGARRAAAYLSSEKARPAKAAFWHRDAPARDGCNGLVGQAWTLEALAWAAPALEDDTLAKLGEEVFLAHPFDARAGLWHRLEIDGRALGIDFTFNHQLWFAAAGAQLAPHAAPEVAARVARFADHLDANLALHPSGLVRHPLTPRAVWRTEPRYALRYGRHRYPWRRDLREKAVGYHAFNLHALATLARHLPEHRFFRGKRFERAWRYAQTPDFRSAVDAVECAWPYNPTGIEMAWALEVFGRDARAEQQRWLAEQLRRHFDFASGLMHRATPDPTTLAARLCEAARLPDLAVPDPGKES